MAGNYHELSISAQYVAALYWSVTTTLTVGYGDIVPKSTNERIISIIMILFGCGVFGYALNAIASIVESINSGFYKNR